MDPAREQAPVAASAARLRGALAARRWVVIVAPLLAGLLAIVASIADPAAGEDGRALVAAYAEDPGRVQVKSVAYHFSYALWLPVVAALVVIVRGRGSWLANGAGLLAIFGLTTMPGLLIVDLFDSTAGRELGVEAAVGLGDRVEEMWALGVIAGTATIGFILSLPVAAAAAWRAGLVRWWAPAAVVIGLVAFAVSMATLPGTIVMAAAFATLSLALARIEPTAWGGANAAPITAPTHLSIKLQDGPRGPGIGQTADPEIILAADDRPNPGTWHRPR